MPRARKALRAAALPASSAPVTPTGTGIAAERAHVGGGVARAARNALLPHVTQDQDGRLAADPLGMAVHEPVEDEVPGDDEAAAREARRRARGGGSENGERHGRGL